jgi:hypothetical protein
VRCATSPSSNEPSRIRQRHGPLPRDVPVQVQGKRVDISPRYQQPEGQQRATARNRVIPGATPNRKQSDSFTQVRPQVSAFFCTASSRPSPRPAAAPPPRTGGRALGPPFDALWTASLLRASDPILRGTEGHTGRPWGGRPTPSCNVSGGIRRSPQGSASPAFGRP